MLKLLIKPKIADLVDFYIDNGVMDAPPSTVLQIKENKIQIIRQGALTVPTAFFRKYSGKIDRVLLLYKYGIS